MSDHVEPFLEWLKQRRRVVETERVLMALQFDLDGALAAGQPELVWIVRNMMLTVGVSHYLQASGRTHAHLADRAGKAESLFGQLALVDPALADTAWTLLLREAPAGIAEMRAGAADVLEFLQYRLRVRSVASRAEAIQVWAENVKVLRIIGASLGIAESDSWYLAQEDGSGDQVGWYDHIISMVSQQH